MFAAIPMMINGIGKSSLIASFAAYFNVDSERIFLFGAGRMSLYAFLKSLGLKSEDEVLIIGYTCVVVPNAARYLNLKINYVDISDETLNIDTRKLSTELNSKTKVLIVSHNFGLVYEDIPLIKEKYPDLIIIEDAAHALGSTDASGRTAGTIADAAFFSFEFSKPITSGMGGLLLVNNAKYIKQINDVYKSCSDWSFIDRFRIMKSLSIQLLTSGALLSLRGAFVRVLNLFGLSYTTPEEELTGGKPVNYPLRMSNFQAAVLFQQMKEIKPIQNVKLDIAAHYHKIFKDSRVLNDYYDKSVIYLRYPLLFNTALSLDEIEMIKAALIKGGFRLGNWFDDVIYPRGSNRCGYRDKHCLVAESVAERIINLPVGIHSRLSESQLKKMQEIIENTIK